MSSIKLDKYKKKGKRFNTEMTDVEFYKDVKGGDPITDANQPLKSITGN